MRRAKESMRQKLVELIEQADIKHVNAFSTLREELEYEADFLLQNGVIVLPCNVGSTLYDMSGKKCNVEAFNIENDNTTIIVSFECDENCKNCSFDSWHQDYSGEYSSDGEWGSASLPLEYFGKVIFPSREEAEKALKRLMNCKEET